MALIGSDRNGRCETSEPLVLQELPSFSGHGTRELVSAHLEPKPQRLVTSGKDNTVRVWNIENGLEILKLELDLTANLVQLTPDGSVAIVRWNNEVRRFKVPGGDELPVLPGHAERIATLRVSPSGKQLLTASLKGELKLWDLTNEKLIKTIADKGVTSARAIAWSPDGKSALVSDELYGLNLFDLAAGKLVKNFAPKLPRGMAAPHCIVFAGPRRFVTGHNIGDHHFIRFWDPGKSLPLLETSDSSYLGEFRSAASSTDGKRVVSGSSLVGGVIWNVETGKEEGRFVGHQGGVLEVGLTADGRSAHSLGNDGFLRTWSLLSTKEVSRFSVQAHVREVDQVLLAADGKRLFSTSDDGTLRLWDVQTGRELNRIPRKLLGRASISSDGKIATFREQRDFVVWNLESWEEIGRFVPATSGTGFPISNPWGTPAGRDILQQAGNFSEAFRREAAVRRRIAAEDVRFSESLPVVSPDGQAFVYRGTTIDLRRLSDGSLVRTLPVREPLSVGTLAFSRDGSLIAMKRRRGVDILEVASGNLRSKTDLREEVFCLAFTPDDRRLVVGCGWPASPGDRATALCAVRVLNVESGSIIAQAGRADKKMAAGKSLSLSADGRVVYVGCSDGIVRAWKLPE